MTQPTKRLTSLQELLEWIRDGRELQTYSREELGAKIRSLLPAEKKLMEEIWQAGATSVYECVKPEGPCGFDGDTHAINKEIFLNQFKPEQ